MDDNAQESPETRAATQHKPGFHTTLIARLQELDSQSVFEVSLQPLVEFPHNEKTARQRPFLGFFEDMPCFPFLAFQIFAWFAFLSVWVSFGIYSLLEPSAVGSNNEFEFEVGTFGKSLRGSCDVNEYHPWQYVVA
jgi:hypothetical protein